MMREVLPLLSSLPQPVMRRLSKVRVEMEHSYQVHYRHARTRTVGFMVLPDSAKADAEKSRLVALGYIVTAVVPPIGEREKSVAISPSGDLPR